MIDVVKPAEQYADPKLAILAANVERLRERIGISEREMCRRADVSNTAWRTAVGPQATQGPTFSTLRRIASALGVSIADLAEGI